MIVWGRQAERAWHIALVAITAIAVGTAAVDGAPAPQAAGSQVTPLTLQPPRTLAPGPVAIDPGELERWVTGWFGAHLPDPASGAPGAVVALVQGDRLLLVRGFGVADLSTRAPVTPDTVFRVGSLSKPFTATAIMQLAEEGRVRLPAPVNRYLHDMQVPTAFGRDVTILDLATHTAGFDVRLEGTAAAADRDVQPLGSYLRANLPRQVRRSGEVLSYSNHGYALLGHVVEEVTGEAFERYMADRLFAPLGMARSSFRLTPDVQRTVATGYERTRGTFRPSAPIHPRIYPAAGLNTTGNDMARFMIAQLNGGRLEDARILSDTSVADMQRQQFTQSPAMPGIAFGFFENLIRGERALVHGGGIRGFMSGLCLWPRYRLGLFISNNGYSGALVQDFFDAFVRRFFPRREAAGGSANRIALPPPEWFEGAYRAATATRNTLERAGTLLNGDVDIRSVGGYRPHLDFGGDAFVPVGRLEFRLDRGDEPLAFSEGPDRRVSLLVAVTPLLGCEVFEKVRWYQTARLHRELLALFCAAFLSVVLAPLGRRFTAALAAAVPWLPLTDPSPGKGAGLRTILFVVASLDLLFVVLLVVAFRLARDTWMLYGVPPLARFDLVLSGVAAVVTLALPFCAWRAWRRGYWSPAGRVHYTVCAAAALAFIPFLRYWNLLGY